MHVPSQIIQQHQLTTQMKLLQDTPSQCIQHHVQVAKRMKLQQGKILHQRTPLNQEGACISRVLW